MSADSHDGQTKSISELRLQLAAMTKARDELKAENCTLRNYGVSLTEQLEGLKERWLEHAANLAASKEANGKASLTAWSHSSAVSICAKELAALLSQGPTET